ncbi:class I SAM-dependent methyltransferase [Polynucleobacter sphagniphilus]|jgi:hypothetical protein|uniref:Methyltransferase n=1 Tax=Polynucleobacter sphagniphilus TaxID=1743169 RepID=A0AA43M9Q9_9BURK|nr:class I SAM-dependent methyltransferase [Polynucleobacter sphagniphilus]MDH6504771.1 hypothetical protein [Polynucleobacter sphagniphilus]MDH6513484.1 hypothetical protein [Polynucleobacter sphagniphilus]
MPIKQKSALLANKKTKPSQPAKKTAPAAPIKAAPVPVVATTPAPAPAPAKVTAFNKAIEVAKNVAKAVLSEKEGAPQSTTSKTLQTPAKQVEPIAKVADSKAAKTEHKDTQLPKLGELSLENIINFDSPQFFGISNPARFFELMNEVKSLIAPGFYFGDNLFTWMRNNSMFEDQVFRKAWEENSINEFDRSSAWRRYILATSAYHCLNLPGDFVECGVYQGSGLKMVIDYLGGMDFPKKVWGFDLFTNDAAPSEDVLPVVQSRFKSNPMVTLVKGIDKSVISKSIGKQAIAFLHIDLNNAERELEVLELLFNQVVTGGMVILDDYEWAGGHRQQKKTLDPWFDQQGYRVLPLPTGQGLLIKR